MDRCTRIAELLLIENEVLRLEDSSSCFNISKGIKDSSLIYNYNYEDFTPIEKIMYAILTRIQDRFWESYKSGIEIGVQCQKTIGKYRVDFLVSATFSDTQVIIECDGHDFHEKTKEQAIHDKERDRFLTSQGYKILRYTGSELYNDFDRIEKELSELLDYSPNSLFREIK